MVIRYICNIHNVATFCVFQKGNSAVVRTECKMQLAVPMVLSFAQDSLSRDDRGAICV